MKKILIIEDDNHLQIVLQEALSSEGYETNHAVNGQLGMSLARAYKPDLILLDIMMPGGIDGMEVLKSIKKDAVLKDIPVLILTNLSGQESEALEMGAAGYLIKANMSISSLMKEIKAIFEKGEK